MVQSIRCDVQKNALEEEQTEKKRKRERERERERKAGFRALKFLADENTT